VFGATGFGRQCRQVTLRAHFPPRMHLKVALRKEPHMPTLWLLRFQLQIATLPRKQWSVHSHMQTVVWGISFCLGMITQISCEKEATVFKAQPWTRMSTFCGNLARCMTCGRRTALRTPRLNLCTYLVYGRISSSQLPLDRLTFRSITVVRSSSNPRHSDQPVVVCESASTGPYDADSPGSTCLSYLR